MKDNEIKTKTVRIDKQRLKSLVKGHKNGRGWVYSKSGISQRTFARLLDEKSDSKINIETIKPLVGLLNIPLQDIILDEDIGPSVCNLTRVHSFAGHPSYSEKENVHKYYNCNIDDENSNYFKNLNEFIYRSAIKRRVRGNTDELINSENTFIESLANANSALKNLKKQNIGMFVGEYYAYYIASWDYTEPEQFEREDWDPRVDDEHERYDVKYIKYINFYPAFEKVKIVSFFKSDVEEIQVNINSGYGNRIETIKAYKEFVESNIEVKSIQNISSNKIEKLFKQVDEMDIYDNHKNNISDISYMSSWQFSIFPKTKLNKGFEFNAASVLTPKSVSFQEGDYKEIKKKEEPMK